MNAWDHWKELKWTWKTGPVYGGMLALALLYEALVWVRLWLYRQGWLPRERLGIPVISVGNLTVGGTGKTPVVDWLLRTLCAQNKRPVVISRGYGRQTRSTVQRLRLAEGSPASARTLGDEPYLLALRHPEIPIYVSANRVLAARLAMLRDQPDVIVLDDGFQHLALHRDLDLLLIDAQRGLGNEHLLPLGPLREPIGGWQRAQAILLTQCNLGFGDRLLHHLHKTHQVTCPLFKWDYQPERLRRLDGQEFLNLEALNGKTALLSSGIAQPTGFTKTVEKLGARVLASLPFPDHARYTPAIVHSLICEKQRLQVDFWITTEKDAVKLRAFPELAQSLWVLEMKVYPEAAWMDFFVDFLAKIRIE